MKIGVFYNKLFGVNGHRVVSRNEERTQLNHKAELNMKIKNSQRTRNILWGFGLFILIIALSVLGPTFVELLFEKRQPSQILLSHSYTPSEILSYYGTIFSFIGTIFLGIVTFIQNRTLNKRNMQLEEKNYIANNAIILIPSSTKYDSTWNLYKECTGEIQWLGNVVVLQKENFVEPDELHQNILLEGEFFVETSENVSIEFAIPNVILNFNKPNVPGIFGFLSSDDFKIAEPLTSTTHRIQIILNFGVYELKQSIEKQLLKNNYEISLLTTILIKSKDIVSEYFLIIKVEPKQELLTDETAYFLPRHIAYCKAIMKSKDPYMYGENLK